MMSWLTHLQHIRDKNVIFVGILDSRVDDYGRTNYDLQIEGSKTEQNDEFETTATDMSFLDFTETNPFGDPQ